MLVDVRTEEELAFVGRVPQAIHVPWATWPGMRPNPDFLSDLEDEMPDKAMPVLFLCRSGQRSAAAAAAATAAAYDHAYNIAEGFEGNLDDEQHRGSSRRVASSRAAVGAELRLSFHVLVAETGRLAAVFSLGVTAAPAPASRNAVALLRGQL